MKSVNSLPVISSHPGKQQGAVLIVSLIMLIVMTLLGLSTMNKAGMQEKMAANNQERVRAFQAAETGIAAAFNSGANFDVNNVINSPTTNVGQAGPSQTSYTFSTSYLSKSIPFRGSGWDAEFFSFYNFNIASSSNLASGARATLNGGIYQVGSK